MLVKFFNPGKIYKRHRDDYLREIDRVLTAGDLILRRDLETLEKNLAAFLGVKHAVGVSNGTDALFLAQKVNGVGPGDEVITVSHTFKSTITSILLAGALPVLVDVEYDGMMDMEEMRKAITGKTKAIIPVHLEGNTADMESLLVVREVMKEKYKALGASLDIQIIEDAAQALGAECLVKGERKRAGSFGTGCFSLYPAKLFGSLLGDAGLVTTNDDQIADELREARNHYKGRPGSLGGNYRFDNVAAAVLNVRFNFLEDIILRREEIAFKYLEGLSGLPLVLPKAKPGRVWQDFVIRVPDGERDDFRAFLAGAGVETMKPPLPPHMELNLGLKLPVTEHLYVEQLRLPINDTLTDAEIGYVIGQVRNYYA